MKERDAKLAEACNLLFDAKIANDFQVCLIRNIKARAEAAEAEIATLKAAAARMKEEIAALNEALDGAHYLAGRYRALWEGKVVRDLAEAEAAYATASRRLGRAQAALNTTENRDA